MESLSALVDTLFGTRLAMAACINFRFIVYACLPGESSISANLELIVNPESETFTICYSLDSEKRPVVHMVHVLKDVEIRANYCR